MAWRQAGNDLFKRKEYAKAIMAYSKEITDHPDDHVLISNRAEAFLKLKQYTEAYHDALDVTVRCDTDVKGHYRLARALSGLDRFEEARGHLETALRLDRSNFAVADELKSVRALALARRKVKWTNLLCTLLDEAQESAPMHSDCDDHVGDVEVQHSWTGKGRGLFATQDIPAGTVILACKAIAMVYTHEGDKGAAANGTPAASSDRLCSKLLDSLVEVLAESESGDRPSKLQEQVSKLCIGNGPSTPRPKPLGDENRDVEATRDWLQPIVKCNAYASTSWDPLSGRQLSSDIGETEIGSSFDRRAEAKFNFGYGLWDLPSYVNHCCLFNAFRFTIGNFFVLVSNRDICRTEEITTFYIRPDEPERRLILKADYGFACKCLLCAAETSMPAEARGYAGAARRKLEELSEQITKYDAECMDDLKLCLTCARQADDRKLLRPNRLLCDVLAAHVLMYAHNKHWDCATEALDGAHEALVGKPRKEDADDLDVPFGGGSASPEPLLVELAIQLSCVLSRQRRFNEARKWLDRARRTSLLLFAVADVADAYFGHHFRLAEHGLEEGRKQNRKLR